MNIKCHVNCDNNYILNHNNQCECPIGFVEVGNECIDVDECDLPSNSGSGSVRSLQQMQWDIRIDYYD